MARFATSTTPAVPAASRLVRRPATAPRSLRVAPDHSDAPPVRAATPSAASRRAFSDACLPYQPEMYAVALRLTRTRDDALDLVQETLMRAMTAWDSFEPGSNVRAWLLRIVTNTFITGYRKRRRHQRFATECPGDALRALYGTPDDRTADPSVQRAAETLGDEVESALGQLGPDYREVVERADLRGESYRHIADELNVPIGTVMSRLFRARRQLELQLRDYAAEDYGIRRAA
jgi:RNA polymerase sigma-70 factor (ECF subfamily)